MRFKTAEEVREQLSLYRPQALAERYGDALERMDGLASIEEEGSELLFATEAGCLIPAVICCGVPQMFFYPEPLMRDASEEIALALIADFCRVNEIREVITDLPSNKLPLAMKGVLHSRLDAVDDGYYAMTVETECMLLDNFPELMYEDIYLGEPTLNFRDEYKRLVFDPTVNKYTGYDIRREIPDIDPADMVEEARADFERGMALTLFATVLSDSGENVFIGEGVLYRFDGRGGAEISVRLLPEWQGKGYGKKLVAGLIELSHTISLKHLYAVIDAENEVSVGLFSSVMKLTYDDGLRKTFTLELDETP